MLTIHANDFIGPSTITKPISDELFTWDNIQYFDNDGFQLSKLEQEFYKANGVELNYINGVWGAQREWIASNHPNYVVDHSMIITRCAYEGEALEQIKHWMTKYPYLLKYTKIRPKWGIDFALEFFEGDEFFEVLHIELDYESEADALVNKEWIEQQLLSTTWVEFAASIKKHTAEWKPLEGMERNNWKARHWGLTRAENILKVV